MLGKCAVGLILTVGCMWGNRPIPASDRSNYGIFDTLVSVMCVDSAGRLSSALNGSSCPGSAILEQNYGTNLSDVDIVDYYIQDLRDFKLTITTANGLASPDSLAGNQQVIVGDLTGCEDTDTVHCDTSSAGITASDYYTYNGNSVTFNIAGDGTGLALFVLENGSSDPTVSIGAAGTPEPGSLALLSGGLVGLAVLGRRARRRGIR